MIAPLPTIGAEPRCPRRMPSPVRPPSPRHAEAGSPSRRVRRRNRGCVAAGGLLAVSLAAVGCDRKPTAPPAPSATVSETAAPVDEDPPAGPRPQTIDGELTAERRARIEGKIPEAAGFLVAADIERELQEDKEVDREEVALEKLDARLAGKWVLFVGPMLERDAEGYVVTVTYHAGSKRDQMGVTPSWLRIEVANIRGYSTILTEDGMQTAVLAKYVGKGKARPAHDLVGRGIW